MQRTFNSGKNKLHNLSNKLHDSQISYRERSNEQPVTQIIRLIYRQLWHLLEYRACYTETT